MAPDVRVARVAAVLDAVSVLGRRIEMQRRAPFSGRALTPSQMRALHVLAHSPSPVTPKRLASTLGVTAGAVTQLVDGLRAADLVEAVPHPDDARSRILRLTPDAAAEVRAFEADVVRQLLPAFDGLGDGDLTRVATVLAGVTDRL